MTNYLQLFSKTFAVYVTEGYVDSICTSFLIFVVF
jgi:hypothetical protein